MGWLADYGPVATLIIGAAVTSEGIKYAMMTKELGGLDDALAKVFFYHPALMSSGLLGAAVLGRASYLLPLAPSTARSARRARVLCTGFAV